MWEVRNVGVKEWRGKENRNAIGMEVDNREQESKNREEKRS